MCTTQPPDKRGAILEVTKSKGQAYLRAAGLMVYGHETGKYYCSPYDNPWIEAYNKSLEYLPACPERFETVQDVEDWVNLYGRLHNDYPHSALGYVRPNEGHEGYGDAIRQKRNSVKRI